MKRLILLALTCLYPAACTQPPAADPQIASAAQPVAAQKTTASPSKTGGDPAAARALFDEAVRVHMAGDEIGYHQRMLRLAIEHPNTRYGRAANRRLGNAGSAAGVAVAGLVAGVSIPAFITYTRRAKTSEALMNVRRMFDGGIAYYNAEHIEADGSVAPRRFPDSAGPTPHALPCAEGERYEPRPDQWMARGWVQLGFSVEGPHYYRYEFISAGTGKASSFTARAIGDLDCDGVYSTFERVGTVDSAYNANGGAGLFLNQELE